MGASAEERGDKELYFKERWKIACVLSTVNFKKTKISIFSKREQTFVRQERSEKERRSLICCNNNHVCMHIIETN